MSNSYKDKYVNDLGQTYQVSTPSSKDIPEFGMDSQEGDLSYRKKVNQEEHQFQISNSGNLQSELDNLSIDSKGRLSVEETWTLVTDSDVAAIQKRIELIRSHNKKIKIKVTLFDENYLEIDSLVGKISEIDFDKTSNSDIRSKCTLTLSLSSKDQINLDFERTWNKRMVELACGIFDRTKGSDYHSNDNYEWFKLGRMLMVGGETTFDATTQEVKLKLVDLMASLTSERGSQIGSVVVFKAGADIHDALDEFIKLYSPFKQTNICVFEDVIPYDIESVAGDYPIDVLNDVLELFPTHEMFFDSDGIFTIKEIPTKIADSIDIGHNIIDELLISESRKIDFSEIKNTTEIYGRELHGDYVAISCTTSNKTYNIVIDNDTFTEMVSGETYTIVPNVDSVVGQKMKIQTLPEYQIYTESGTGSDLTFTPIKSQAMLAGIPYVVKYFEEKFILQGELNIHCIIQEITEIPSVTTQNAYKAENNCYDIQWVVNPDSPFACWLDPSTGNIKGEIRQVLQDGEYDNIYTTQLAYERAKYENWLNGRLNDTIEVEMILIPWMEINDKIEFTSPVSGEVGVWIVQEIEYDFEIWTMRVKANKFYPYYPW